MLEICDGCKDFIVTVLFEQPNKNSVKNKIKYIFIFFSFVFLYFKSLLYRKSDFNNILEIIEA
jgi:hypothetical protein